MRLRSPGEEQGCQIPTTTDLFLLASQRARVTLSVQSQGGAFPPQAGGR